MSFTIPQNIFFNDPTVITVTKCSDDALTIRHLQPFLDATDNLLGISATYGKQCQLASIAFSMLSHVLVINVPVTHVPQPKDKLIRRLVAKSRSLIQHHLLTPRFVKYAFRMDQLAIALHLDLSTRICNAVDMLSVTTNNNRQSLQALMDAMGGEMKLEKKNVKALFSTASESPTVDATARVALQAWAACRAATLSHMSSRFASIRTIDTRAFSKKHLDTVARISRHGDRLEALKPTVVKNDVKDQCVIYKDAINLVCDRFSTRIRKSGNQVLRIETEGKGARNQVTGRARKVDGRSARITVDGHVRAGKILSVTTIGKDDPTCAESARQDVILKTLQGNGNVLFNPFFQALWLPEQRPVWPESKGQKNPLTVHFSRELNASQHASVRRVLSDEDDDRVVVIQGPPGTGKTTVIAASVISHHYADSSQCIWVAAQSNVAVKNIAEKFAKEGFCEFRVLVSKDFHHDWHEHLYEKVEPCLIRSDTFKMSVVAAERALLGCKVILCTLSMLSNPSIDVFLRLVPVETLILDEASQIECGNYLPIFHRFHSTLAKLVFIGDHEQLPPYGQEDISELRSVFEFPHLRSRVSFLDTQYRMPHVIGNFISRNVYGGKLRTCHDLRASTTCRFIDVTKGREVKNGHSWINEAEARIVVKLAELHRSKGMSFRIITPYDAQRCAIENLLKRENVPWEDKVFNVDSFQGNEDDHIIVSVVRTQGPGFLRNKRRTNVMLTRCKKSMVICSSRAFLFGSASKTLIGRLAASLKEENWINVNGYA